MSLLNNLKEEYFMGIFKKLTYDEKEFFKQLNKVATTIKNDVGDLPNEYNELLKFKDLPKESKFYKLQSILKNLNEDIVELRKNWQQPEITKKYVEALKNYESAEKSKITSTSAKNSKITSDPEVSRLRKELFDAEQELFDAQQKLFDAQQKLQNTFDQAIAPKISDYGRMLEKLHKFRSFGDRHDAKKLVSAIFRSLMSGKLLKNQFNILLSEITLKQQFKSST